jgi:CRP-like cAMP-binding protein
MTPFQPGALDALVRNLSRHSELSNEDEAAILSLPHTLRTFEEKSFLLREGDHPTVCPILIRGYACRHKVTGGGSRQILSLNIPGDALDFQNLLVEEADHNIQMLTRGEVAKIPVLEISRLIEARPAVAQAIMVATMVESAMFREWTVSVGRRDARSRIAHLLCEFAYRVDSRGLSDGETYELPMNQEELGDATGLTAVHVNRVLKRLEAEGLIARNRRAISFPDRECLAELADFTPRYLHVRDGVSPRLRRAALPSVRDFVAAAC